jgi:hypothetical protein
MVEITKIMMKLRESIKLDPVQDISHLVPRIYGVYGWFNKKDDSIEYVGSATGKSGLYQRIINQHLKKSYLLTIKEGERHENDEYQMIHYAIRKNRKPAIDKSAFRKNISRYNKLSPGSESVNFIKNNFYLHFLTFDNKDEALNVEKELIANFRPKYNIL